jgi:hypothetical protein
MELMLSLHARLSRIVKRITMAMATATATAIAKHGTTMAE